MEIFKACDVLYFAKTEIFAELISTHENIFKGKIIISDFQELNRICSINGIIHVLNISTGNIPNETIDCIVTDKNRSSDLESKLVKSGLSIPIVYVDLSRKQQNILCGICNKIYNITNDKEVSKYCSEKCMKKDNGFTVDSKPETLKDLAARDIMSKIVETDKNRDFSNTEDDLIIKFDKSVSVSKKESKKSADKFQSSVVRDAIRLQYAVNRDSYKKGMKQPSLRKVSLSDKKKVCEDTQDFSPRLCKGITKKGHQCTNRTIGSSNYCGILSHSMGGSATEVMASMIEKSE